ncbi:MAG: hypothetical protein K2N74_02090, partial [Clostridiales bacterium]|nr:hypothetical protein [Clostridiales bacterium]
NRNRHGRAGFARKVAKADDTLRSLNDKLRLFEVGLERKSGEAKVIGEQIRSYRTQLSRASDDVEYSLRRALELDVQAAASEKNKTEGEKRVQEIEKECAVLMGQLREADARFDAYERISSEKRASEISSVEDLADLRANVGSLSARRDATNERISEVRAAIEKAKLREQEFVREAEECKAQKQTCEKFLDEEGAVQEKLAEEVQDLSRSRQKLTEDIVGCNTSIANLSHNLELYQDLKNRFDGYRDSVRKLQLTAKEKPEIGAKIKGAIADIVSTEAKY